MEVTTNKGVSMGMTLAEAYKIMREQQSDIHTWQRKCIEAQSHAYELMFPGDNKNADDLKAQVYYLTTELKKVIEQRDYYKERIRVLHNTGKKGDGNVAE